MTVIKQFTNWLDEDVEGFMYYVQLFCKAAILMCLLAAFFALFGWLF